MKFCIFKGNIDVSGGVPAVSFIALKNIVGEDAPLVLEVDNYEQAVREAKKLLETMQIKLHSIRGDCDLIMTEVPNYYVGKLEDEFSDKYDDYNLRYHICNFIPIQ